MSWFKKIFNLKRIKKNILKHQEQIDSFFILFKLTKDYNEVILFTNKGVIDSIQVGGLNDSLLNALSELLNKANLKKENISGLAILNNQGSFTSSRIATLIANGFLMILNVPIVFINEKIVNNWSEIIKQIKNKKDDIFLSTQYSGLPNIKK